VCRAVALSDSVVQEKIAKFFIPLKVEIKADSKEIPLVGNWPALAYWRPTREFCLNTLKSNGFFGCSVVSPDIQTEYANPGPSLPWQAFDSFAVDAKKFAAMLDRAEARATRERAIRADKTLSVEERERNVASFRAEVKREVTKETAFPLLPPKGFKLEYGREIDSIPGWNTPQK